MIRQLQTYCAMCISRCGVIATVEDSLLKKVTMDSRHPNGCICVKGTAAPEMVYSADRLQRPMVRTRPKGDRDPGWQAISWDDAMNLLASRLLDIRARHGPESVVFGYATSRGSATSDFSLWVQRLANAFGSPNLQNHLHLCNWHREYGSEYTFGTGFPYPDYDNARCILLWGFNPEASWPAAAVRISRAKARGAKIIVIDPRRASTVDKADVWLRVRPGADDALALAMIHVLLEERLYDDAFVRAWTNAGFLIRRDTGLPLMEEEAFFVWDEHRRRHVRYRKDLGYEEAGVVPALDGTYDVALADGTHVACRPGFALLADQVAPYAPELSEKRTGVPAADVRRAVRMFAGEKPSCYFTWVGLEQHSNAMQINRATSIFYALTGQFDRRGSNVLFGVTPTSPVAGKALLPKAQAAKRIGYAERPLGPPGPPGLVQAYNVYRAILDGEPYRVRGIVTFGSDHLLANGDPLRGRAALAELDFYAHMDLFENPSASMADLLLPAASCWEREGLMPSFDVAEDTANWAHLRTPVVAPLHDTRPEMDVIFELATKLGLGEHFFDGNVEAALDYQLAPAGITARALREEPMGMRTAARTRYEKYTEMNERTGRPHGFATPTGKMEIYSTTFARAGHPALPVCETRTEPCSSEFPLVLTFFRVVQFCDESHRNVPRLRRQVPDPYIEIHPATAAALGIDDGQWIIVESAAGGATLRAKYSAFLHPDVVCTQYGWWQGCNPLKLPSYDPFSSQGANANLLIANDAIDPISGSVRHRSQRCRVRKSTSLEECEGDRTS